jgi:acetyl esterase/lipase
MSWSLAVPPTSGYAETELFPGGPPNLVADAAREYVGEKGFIHEVSVPTLRRYRFNWNQNTGIALVVFPGGGYHLLDIETHAAALSAKLGPRGFSVFGLKYRVASGTKDAPRDALLDAQRAIRLVRAHAKQWGFEPDRIGVVGYSAGAHLAMALAAGFDDGNADALDPIERVSSRPDFVAGMCTWSFGNTDSPFAFTRRTPPLFLCHAEDDDVAPIGLAHSIERRARELDVSAVLHTYPNGGHSAFHVADPAASGRLWPDRFVPWLPENGVPVWNL